MKAWWLNDYECWAGETLNDAIADWEAETGCQRDEGVNDPHEATPDTRVNMDEDGNPAGPFMTIGEILATMDKPGFVCGWDT